MINIKEISALLGLIIFMPMAFAETNGKIKNNPIPQLLMEIHKHQEQERFIEKNLKTFDTLDFDVYTHQKWDRLGESHTQDILVHYPDGRTTKGLAAHVEELKPLFQFAPDARIETHPVRIGQGEWTAVIGVSEGTFSQPMRLADGKTIPPTGKKFKLTMATIAHWTKDGLMDEEFLFWDNLSLMRQIGLMP